MGTYQEMDLSPNTKPVVADQMISLGEVGWLYRRYAQRVFQYLVYRTTDQHVAEDLTSEVFLKALNGQRPVAMVEMQILPWLLRIARNLSIDHYRQALRNPMVELPESLPAPQGNPETSLERTLARAQLQQAISQLPEAQRDVVVLRFVLGLPLQEVALAIRRSENAVKGLQRRALLALRDLLRPADQE